MGIDGMKVIDAKVEALVGKKGRFGVKAYTKCAFDHASYKSMQTLAGINKKQCI